MTESAELPAVQEQDQQPLGIEETEERIKNMTEGRHPDEKLDWLNQVETHLKGNIQLKASYTKGRPPRPEGQPQVEESEFSVQEIPSDHSRANPRLTEFKWIPGQANENILGSLAHINAILDLIEQKQPSEVTTVSEAAE